MNRNLSLRRFLSTHSRFSRGKTFRPELQSLEGREVPAVYTWVPTTAGAHDWSNAANWTSPDAGATYPNAIDDVANINIDIAGDQTITLTEAITIGTLNIGDADGSSGITLAGSLSTPLTFDGATRVLAKTNPATTSTGTDIIAVPVSLTGDLAVSNAIAASPTSARLLMTGAVSGIGGLALSGVGVVALSNTNNYDGVTSVDSGASLVVSADGALGSTVGGTTVNSGGSLYLANVAYGTTEALTLAGTGLGGEGALAAVNGGATSFAGPITLADATTIATNASNLIIGGTIATAGFALTANTSSNIISLGGVISGTGSLTKNGTGTLILGGSNTYSGGTTVSTGTMEATAAGRLPNTGTTSIDSGATVSLTSTGVNNYGTPFSGAGTIQVTMSGGVSDTILSGNSSGFTGTLVLNGSGSNKLNGTGLNLGATATIVINTGAQLMSIVNMANPITVLGTGNGENRGAIRLVSGTLSGPITLLGNTTFGPEGGTITGTISSGVAGTQTLTIGTTNSLSNLTLGNVSDGVGTLALTKTANASTLTINGLATYTGSTTVQTGTFIFNNATAPSTSSIIASAGVIVGFAALDQATVDKITTTPANAAFTVAISANNSNSLDFSGAAFTNATLGATGNFTYSGATLTPNSNTYRFGGLATGTLTISTALTGANDLLKTGSSTLILSGANTHTGTTTISGGILTLANNSALGTGAGGTTVTSGTTLALQGGITISGEAITIDGSGFTGQLGALVNLSGNNTIDATSSIVAAINVNSTFTIASAASTTFSIQAPVDLKYSKLTVTGPGNTNISGVVSGSITASGFSQRDYILGNQGFAGLAPLAFWEFNETTGNTALDSSTNANNGTFGSSATRVSGRTGAAGDGALDFTATGGVTVPANSGQFNAIAASDQATLAFWAKDSVIRSNITFAALGAGVDNRVVFTHVPWSDRVIYWDAGGDPNSYQRVNTAALDASNYTNPDWNYYTFTKSSAGAFQAIYRNGVLLASGAGTQAFANIVSLVIAPDHRGELDDVVLLNSALTSAQVSTLWTLRNPISNDISKTGTGTLTFGGANAYSGTTTISDGTLLVTNSSGLGSDTGGTVVSLTGSLALSGGITIATEPLTLISQASLADQLVNVAGNNTYAGPIAVLHSRTIVSTFTGGDDGQGLDLRGNFLYAVDVGGNGGVQVQDAIFTGTETTTTPGFSITAPQLIPSWLTPNFGDSPDDNNLETVTRSIRWNSFPGSVTTTMTGLTPGNAYKLQLIIQDNGGRNFNILVNGNTIRTGFDTSPGSTTTVGNLITYIFTAASDTAVVSLDGSTLPANNRDPILNAITLEAITTYPQLAATGIRSDSGTLTIPVDITLTSTTLNLGGAGNITTSGVISGSNSAITKSGTGTLTLAGNNTYGGATTISAGTVIAPTENALGTAAGGTSVALGATLQLTGTYATPLAEPFNLNGNGSGNGVLVSSGGPKTLSGPITVSGFTTVNNTDAGSANTLTITGDVSHGAVSLTTTGAGDITINGNILASPPTPSDAYTATILNDLPLNYWQFNDTAGTTAVEANGRNNATISGAVTLNQPGPLTSVDANSRSFSFSGGTLTAPLNTPVQSRFSVEFWLNARTTLNHNQNIGQGWGRFVFHTDAGGSVYTGNNVGDRITPSSTGGQIPNGTVVANQWAHFVYTFDSTLGSNNTKLYKNGALVGQKQATTGASPLTAITFAADVNAWASDLAVYNYPLSATQISSHYASSSAVVANPITKNGSGTLTLAGNNTYAGTTTVNSGVLVVTNANALGTGAGSTTVNSGSSLVLSGGITVSNETISINGPGAAGQLGALASNGVNSLDSTTSLTTVTATDASLTLAAPTATDTLNIASTFDTRYGKIFVAGAGNTNITSAITIGAFSGPTQADYILGSATAGLPGLNPLAYWQFNETSGTAVLDSSTNANGGSYGAGVSRVSGRTVIAGDGALNFTADGGVTIPVVVNSVNRFAAIDTAEKATLGFWAQDTAVRNNTTFQALTSGGARVVFTHTPWSDGVTYWDAGAGERIQANGGTTAGWHWWVMTKEVGSQRLYRDGVQIASGTGTQLFSSIASMVIAPSHRGTLDDVFLLASALPAATVTSMWNARNNLGLASRDVIMTGTGTLTLSGANTQSNTIAQNGTIVLGANNTLAAGSTLTVENAAAIVDIGTTTQSIGTVALVDGTITGSTGILTANTAVDLRKGTISAILDGPAAVTKTTTDTVTLSAENTYTGATTVSAGVLLLTNNLALGSASTGTTVTSGGTLALSGGLNINGEAFTLSGLGAAGQPGALVNASGNNTIDTASTISATNSVNGAPGIGSTTLGETLTINAPVDLKISKLTVSGAGNVVMNGVVGTTSTSFGPNMRDYLLGAPAFGLPGLNPIGFWEFNETSGSTALDSSTNANNGTFTTGVNRVAGRTTAVPGDGALNFTATGGVNIPITSSFNTIDTNDQVTLGFWTKDPATNHSNITVSGIVAGTGNRVIYTHAPYSDGNVYWDSGTSYLGNRISTTHGVVSGWTWWVMTNKPGEQRIYKNGVQIQAGTGGQGLDALTSLVLGQDYRGTLDDVFILDTTLSATTVSEMYANRDKLGSAFVNNSLEKTGNGTLTLAGANTYSGTTSLVTGTLVAENPDALGTADTLAWGGTLMVTSPNRVTGSVDVGSLTFNGGTVSFDILGSTAGAPDNGYDLVTSTGPVDLGTATNLTVSVGTYTPDTATFTIITGSAITGEFVGLAENGIITASDSTQKFIINYTATTVTLTVPAPILTSITPTEGPLGTNSVTVNGTYLTGSTITFGGVAASYVSGSDSQILVTAPAGSAGTVDVVATTIGGTATLVGAYTYVAAPTITRISPATGSTAGGTPVTILGSNFTATTTVSIGGTAATSIVIVSSGELTAVTPAGTAGQVDVVITTIGGTTTLTNGFTYVGGGATLNSVTANGVLSTFNNATTTYGPVSLADVSTSSGFYTFSRIVSLELTFSDIVHVDDGAFTLYVGDIASPTYSLTNNAAADIITLGEGTSTIQLNFANANVDGLEGTSLQNGIWKLRVDYTKIQVGAANGPAAGTQTDFEWNEQIRRLFGDANGDGNVGPGDFTAFGTVYTLQDTDPDFNPLFNSNNNSSIDPGDFTAFGTNFGQSL